MTVNATLINLYHVCKRECWLHANGIRMEHTSDMVYEGKLLHETSYPQRNEKHSELELHAEFNGIDLFGKIDFYDAQHKIIHETKHGDSVKLAHAWQIKFYLWLLALNGISDTGAVIEYPLLRQTHKITLSLKDVGYIHRILMDIRILIESAQCPPVINAKICSSCSYYELCYISE